MSHEPPRESATPDEPDVEAPSPEFSQALEVVVGPLGPGRAVRDQLRHCFSDT